MANAAGLFRKMVASIVVVFVFFFRFLWFALLLLVAAPGSWILSQFINLILPANFTITRVDLRISLLPKRFHGVKLLHLTDFHYNGSSRKLVSDELLSNIVHFVNNEPNVSLLLLTGDYVQRKSEPIEELCSRWLRRMKPVAEGRAYACLGTRDCLSNDGKEAIVRSLEAVGIPVLQNQFILPFAAETRTTLSSSNSFNEMNSSSTTNSTMATNNKAPQTSDQLTRDNNFMVVGLGDLTSNEFHPEKVMNEVASLESSRLKRKERKNSSNALQSCSTPLEHNELPVVIALSHNPDTASTLSKWRITLQLSGHTHGGQICLPNTGRPLLEYVVKMNPYIQMMVPEALRECVKRWDWARGLSRIPIDSKQPSLSSPSAVHQFFLYTGSGLASHAGLRLFCPPEVTVFTLLRDEKLTSASDSS